jgi:hypothetical protein
MKSRSVILRIEGEGFREQRKATRPGQGQRGGTRHTCHRIIGDWQPPWYEATGIAQSQDEDPKPEDGRALQGVRIEQEPSAIPDRCRSMGPRIREPLR